MSDWKQRLKEMSVDRNIIKIEVYDYEDDIKKGKKISNADLPYFYDPYGYLRVRYFGRQCIVKRKNWYSLFLKPLINRGEKISNERKYYIVKNNE